MVKFMKIQKKSKYCYFGMFPLILLLVWQRLCLLSMQSKLSIQVGYLPI